METVYKKFKVKENLIDYREHPGSLAGKIKGSVITNGMLKLSGEVIKVEYLSEDIQPYQWITMNGYPSGDRWLFCSEWLEEVFSDNKPSLTEFKEGNFYRWIGPQDYNENFSDQMEAWKDGLWRKCLKTHNRSWSLFENIESGHWFYGEIFQFFEEKEEENEKIAEKKDFEKYVSLSLDICNNWSTPLNPLKETKTPKFILNRKKRIKNIINSIDTEH